MSIDLLMDETLADARTVNEERETVRALDEESFRAFYERTARGVWAYLVRITGDRHLADDLLQEAFYRFYRSGAKHENENHRRNSLYLIATNLARDVARRGTHVQFVPLLDNDEHHDRADRSALQTEARTELANAMTQLDPRQREMLWLAYAHGASHEEIAGVLGLKTRSIKTLLLRARRKLASLLRGESKS
jgi:RNA polymerase sigma-70 factor (ECF subfamily)